MNLLNNFGGGNQRGDAHNANNGNNNNDTYAANHDNHADQCNPNNDK